MTSTQSVKPKLARDNPLDIAFRLYQAMCAQYPDRLIVLSNESGRVVAQSGGAARSELTPRLRL